MSQIRQIIKAGLLKSVGNVPDYKTISNAKNWLTKGVLTEDDIEEIKAAVERKSGVTT